MESNPSKTFPGFPKTPATNYWPYPKALNGWWHILTGTEQKVLDYLLRHTWGYNKTADRISYSQFSHGIKRNNGIWLDRGCGVKSPKALCKALKGLMGKSFLKVEKTTGKTNYYILKFADDEANGEALLPKGKYPSFQSKEVGTSQGEDTIKDITIKRETIGPSSFKKKLKPFFWGQEMRKDQRGKWWIIPKDGGQWLEFTGSKEEIQWQ